MTTVILIFGAPANAKGEATGTLIRRVQGAYSASKSIKNTIFLASGGAVKSEIVEAVLIRDLLIQFGVSDSDIYLDGFAKNTLGSVKNCRSFIDKVGDIEAVVPCSSRYHLTRCKILMQMLSIPTVMVQMPGDRGAIGNLKLAKLVIHETISTPANIAMLFLEKIVCRIKRTY